jgi:hypothetical protein
MNYEKPNRMSLRSWFQMQIGEVGECPTNWMAPIIPQIGVDSETGEFWFQLVEAIILGDASWKRGGWSFGWFTNCLEMALFLDFGRVQQVWNSTCQYLPLYNSLWILDLFLRMGCVSWRSDAGRHPSDIGGPDGIGVVAFVQKCQKYARI